MVVGFRVALDARRIVGNRRGVGQYVWQLAKNLPAAAPGVEFLLLLDRILPEGSLPPGCRQVVVGRQHVTLSQSLSGLGSKVYSQYWMNVLVPRVLAAKKVSLFHATNFAVPLVSPCPVVVTIHDLIYARAPGAFESGYERYLSLMTPIAVRRADHVIADSEATRADLMSACRVVHDRISVIHLGVSDEFRPCNEPEYLKCVRATLKLPARFVLHVGAVERRKKLETLVEAAAPLLKSSIVDAVVLAGEAGFGSDAVWRAAEHLGIRDRVLHLGYVPQEMLPGLYNLALVLTLASAYEGFGMPILEAMACGTPTIVSDVSSLPEIAGDAALLVRPGDADGLSRALRSLVTDDCLRQEIRRRGLARAGVFTWQRTAEAHVDVYRRVMRRHPIRAQRTNV
uniref:Glycosyltransferase family 1 protein n=1 Tax=candidate division WOR-3 bacterium TaxID=2052148 RepID=A0A7C4GHF3_UNCW3